MADTGFYGWFREAKVLADESAGGDVAALLGKGVALLEGHGFGPRSHPAAAQRAVYWSSRFGGGEWASVRECVAVLEAADPQHVAAVMQAAAPRSADMNEDLLGWLLGEQSKNLSLPGPGENLRPWAQRVLQFIMNLSEQPAKNYLGMLIAVADPETGHAATQRLELGRLLDRARAKKAAPESVISRLGRARPLRNSAAHMANLSIVDGRVELQGDKWTPEALIGELESLLQTVGVLSLAVDIWSGRAALSDGGDGSAPGDGDDGLAPMEDLLACWMEWSDVKAARSGPQITVTARASGPILFFTLIQAAGFFRGYEGAARAVFDIDHGMDDIGRVVIGFPILPLDADEQAMWDSMPRITIDGEPIHGPYGGIARLMDDHRFVADSPDTPEGQETERIEPPGPPWPVIRAWGYYFTPRASGFLAPP